MAVVKRRAEGAGDLVVRADIADVTQAAAAVAGAAGVAKGLRLKCASSRIPKIGRTSQAERVHFAAQGKLRGWLQVQGAVKVFVIHHVVKRKARVLAGCGQNLEESSVGGVLGIAIAASIRIAGAKPGLQVFHRGLPAEFADESACALREVTPSAALENAPNQEIELTVVRAVDNLHVVPAIRTQPDLVYVRCPNWRRTIVGLQDRSTVIHVAQAEDTQLPGALRSIE